MSRISEPVIPVCSGSCAIIICAGLTLLMGTSAAQESAQTIDPAVAEQAASDQQSRQSQLEVDQLDDQTGSDIAANRQAARQLNRRRIYNSNLEELVADQEREKLSLQQQIDEFGSVERGVVPLMFDMIATLRKFIELDMPFLQKERADRLARLETNMSRSDLSVTERYRQIMEAYQIEVSYGRNIEAYIGTLEIGGEERRVDLLRVGRIVLAYQTLDRTETGFWDKTERHWVVDNSYSRDIADGLRIARKQMAPRLLEMPVPAAGLVK
ncbi:MAG: hypothetical protein DRR11_02435 [Gammaproteobacteria bacterium]|nr:MAG: hypothetical protein DRR15_11940 [Gammaproteobacteria bacterium]RLA34568.1 MAG: hypothetical protein DRR11_02435 [Gammaproteobacteria bacterium]